MSTLQSLIQKKGPTLTLLKSKNSRVFGGFTSQHWEFNQAEAFKEDSSAFIFSMDSLKQYKPLDPSKAIFCSSKLGPSFGRTALSLQRDTLNAENGGSCQVTNHQYGNIYGVGCNEDGSNEVTGETAVMDDDEVNRFTCEDLEIF